MADASTAPDGLQAERDDGFRPRDRFLRLYLSLPVAPPWIGLGIALAYLGIFVAVDRLTGIFGVGGPGESWAQEVMLWETVNGIIIAYLLTANAMGVRSARADMRALRPHLEASDSEFTSLLDRSTNLSAAALWGGVALGAVAGALLPLFDPGVWGEIGRPAFTSPLFLWVLFRNVLIAWCATRAGMSEIALTRGFSQAAGLLQVDLLDARRLAPFARKSQRSLLGWVVFSVLFSLFFLGRPADSNPFFLLLLFGSLLAVFLVPLLAVKERVAVAKNEELARVNERIRDGLDRAGSDADGAPTLADWVAYRGLVEGAREWPIGASGALRALLFAALGVGSWLGGALVERLLGSLLD